MTITLCNFLVSADVAYSYRENFFFFFRWSVDGSEGNVFKSRAAATTAAAVAEYLGCFRAFARNVRNISLSRKILGKTAETTSARRVEQEEENYGLLPSFSRHILALLSLSSSTATFAFSFSLACILLGYMHEKKNVAYKKQKRQDNWVNFFIYYE